MQSYWKILLPCFVSLGIPALLLLPTLLFPTPARANPAACQSTWSEVHAPNVGRAPFQWYSTIAFDSQDVRLSGNYGYTNDKHVATFHWNGQTWQTLEVPQADVGFTLFGGPRCHELEGQDNEGKYLRWTGNAWINTAAPPPAILYESAPDGAVLADNEVWRVGSWGASEIRIEHRAITISKSAATKPIALDQRLLHR